MNNLNLLPDFSLIFFSIKTRENQRKIRKTISYKLVGCLKTPSPKSMPQGNLVSFPKV